MGAIWIKYIPVISLVLVSLLIIALLFVVSYFLGAGTNNIDFEKLSVYECGFEPFTDTQGTFDIKFYLLAMLFMVFDLEIMFLLPWAIAFNILTWTSLLIFIWFTLVLVIAFVYEWLKGALEWQ
jgi:NADH:ubiquinone oxidoreductase subunit 3 (chain A)